MNKICLNKKTSYLLLFVLVIAIGIGLYSSYTSNTSRSTSLSTRAEDNTPACYIGNTPPSQYSSLPECILCSPNNAAQSCGTIACTLQKAIMTTTNNTMNQFVCENATSTTTTPSIQLPTSSPSVTGSPSRTNKGGKGQACYINNQKEPFCDTNLIALKSGVSGCKCEELSIPIGFSSIQRYAYESGKKEMSIPLNISQVKRLYTLNENNNGLLFLYYNPNLSYVDPGNYAISNLATSWFNGWNTMYLSQDELTSTNYSFLYFQPYINTLDVFCKGQISLCVDGTSLFSSGQISEEKLRLILESAQLVNGKDYFIITHNFDEVAFMTEKGQPCNYLDGGCKPLSNTMCTFAHSNSICQSKTTYLNKYSFEYFIDGEVLGETDKKSILLAKGIGNGVTTVDNFTVTYPAPTWLDTSYIYFYLKDSQESKYTSNLNSQYAFFYTCDGKQYKLMEESTFWDNPIYTRPKDDVHLYGPAFECDFKISGKYTVGVLGYTTNIYARYYYDLVAREFGYTNTYSPTQISNKLKALEVIDQHNPSPVIDNHVEISKLSVTYKSSELYTQCNSKSQPYCTEEGYQCISRSVCSNAITIKASQLTSQLEESEFTFFTTDNTTQARKKGGLSILPYKKINNEIEFVRNKTLDKFKPLTLGVRSNIQPPEDKRMTYAIEYDCSDGYGWGTNRYGGAKCGLGHFCPDIRETRLFVSRKTSPYSDSSFKDGPLICYYDGMKDGTYPLKVKYYAADGELTYDQIKKRTPYQFTIDVRVVTR